MATALEIWEGRQSLGFTDPLGKRDLPDAKDTRSYIMASTQHGSAAFNATSGPSFGDCEQQQNPNPQAETMRALWVAFIDWVKDGKQPPPSTKPRIEDGTFVAPEKVSFPAIPANNYANVSPGLALFLGMIPGVGAIYNGQYAKGMVHAIVWGVLMSGFIIAAHKDNIERLLAGKERKLGERAL